MSAGIKLKMHLELDSEQEIKLRRKLNKDGDAQKFFTHEVRRMCDPYVPFDKGPLKNTAIEDVHTITYVQSYAATNYYGNTGHGTQGLSNGGKRGRQWDRRMMADHGEEIVESVANYVGGRSKK